MTLAALNWRKESTLTFELPDGQQWRLTVGTASHYDAMSYRVRMREIYAYFRETYNLDVVRALGKASAEEQPDETDEELQSLNLHFEEYLALTDWASTMSALRRLEVRPDGDSEWQKVEIPAEWQDAKTALHHLPTDLLGIVAQAVDELNPGSLGSPVTAKKKLTLIESANTETSSTNGASPSSTPSSAPKKTSKKSRS